MKYILWMWFVLGCALNSFTQQVTIIDYETEKPLEGAVLISEKPQASVVTNSIGQAEISAFKNAEKIEIRILGYKTQVVSYKQIQDSDFELILEQSVLNLDQVVVSATRWRQNYKNIPSKIGSISQDKVTFLNPQTAADLLGISGKVYIQKSQQGGGSPMIRGFATNRLIYTVDGVRMNTAIFRGGNLQNVINLDPFATEHTEVLFGPGSVIYGSDAIGGVMSFQTLTPQFSITNAPLVNGKALTRYSSVNNEKTGHVDINIGWKKWSVITSFSSWDFDHLRQGRNGPDDYIKNIYPQHQDSMDVIMTQEDPILQIPSAYSQINLMQKVRFKPNEKLDFQYGFHYSLTSAYGRYDRHNRFRNGTLRYSEWNYGPQLWKMHNLETNYQGSSIVFDQLTFRLAKQTFEESRINRSLNKNERSTQTENVGAYSANIDFLKSIGSRNILFYGLEYVLDDVASKGMVTDISTGIEKTGPSRYPQSTWQSIGAYVNDEFDVSEKFTLQAGLRYNLFKLKSDFRSNLDYYPFSFTDATINNKAVTGSLGGIYRPTDSWIMKANFGTAFRSPNVDDIGKVFDSEPEAVTIPNPDLNAEYAYNVDFGVAKIFSEVVKLDITSFYTILQNAMVRRNFQLNGQDSILYDGGMSQVKAIQNAAVAIVYGVQAGLEIRLPAGIMFLSDINYQVGKEELDDGTMSPSRHAAPLFGVSRLRFHNSDLTLEINTVYQGERIFEDLAEEEKGKDEIYAKDANGNNYSPAWYTLNLKAMFRFASSFSLCSGIENITDQRYRPYSSGISGPGRNFVFSAQYNF